MVCKYFLLWFIYDGKKNFKKGLEFIVGWLDNICISENVCY